MSNKQLKKMMAQKMHSYTRPHCHGYVTSKAGAQKWFDAKVNKKALPAFPGHKEKSDSLTRTGKMDSSHQRAHMTMYERETFSPKNIHHYDL